MGCYNIVIGCALAQREQDVVNCDWLRPSAEGAKMTIEEKVARLMATLEGFDPDGVHFTTEIIPPKRINETHTEKLVDSGKKKWEIYLTRAKVHVEIFNLLAAERIPLSDNK